MLRLRQTGKNYLGQHQLGIEFLEVFGRVVYEESQLNLPRQPDWDRAPDLTPPLSTKQFADLIGICFPEFGPAQAIKLIKGFFPEVDGIEVIGLVRTFLPELDPTQVVGLIANYFPELDPTQVVGLIRKCFPELNTAEFLGLIETFFRELDAPRLVGLIRKFFPELNAGRVVEFIPELCPALNATQMFEVIWKGFRELKAKSVIAHVRKVLPGQEFSPWTKIKKEKFKVWERPEWENRDVEREVEFEMPDGIIAHVTRQCGGNVHDHHVVEVTSGSFEHEAQGANPHSGAYDNKPYSAAKNAADLETDSLFISAYRKREEDIPPTRNNWVCYDFKERRIVPAHYTIRTNGHGPGPGLVQGLSFDYAPRSDPGCSHLKSWLVETSADGESWREVGREEDNRNLNGRWFAGTFAVAGGGECRFIRLVNIGRNHLGDDRLEISAWEIFGSLIE
jgi:hypothetical protein